MNGFHCLFAVVDGQHVVSTAEQLLHDVLQLAVVLDNQQMRSVIVRFIYGKVTTLSKGYRR